ncbi:MAG TPA: hypothetical protein VI953_03095 [Candidatus Paceibacterota bacterium]
MKQYLLGIPFVVSVVFLVVCSAPTVSGAATASITQIAFTTDTQSVEPGVLSGVITIQTQNASGVCEKPDETVYLEFTSSSASGQFFTTSGGDLDKYISKNTCNRNFTYKDVTTGLFTITVKAVGKNWQASQQIAVDTGGSTGGSASTTTSSVATGASGGSGVTETVVRPQLLGGVKLHVPKQVSVHSPNYYWAETERFEAVPDMFWNFGDGVSLSGTGAWHTYEHTGRYILSARAPSAGAQAVARSVVEVTEPRLLIASAEAGMSGFVELSNPSAVDLDIGGYELVSGRRSFRIPESTFVVGDGSAFINNRVSGLDIADGVVTLNAQDGTRLAGFSLVPTQAPLVATQGTVLGTSTIDVTTMQKSLTQMRAMLMSMKTAPTFASPLPLRASADKQATTTLSATTDFVRSTSSSVVVVSRKVGLFARLLSIFR